MAAKQASCSRSVVDMPAYELSAQIHAKKVSCKEVMEGYLDHIDKVNPKVNAIVALQEREGLVRQAEEKDAALAKGKSDGWMHGFPQAIKDMEETKGIPSTFASPILKDYIPANDSILVQRMKNAGSIIIGKTNTPEFGLGSHTYNNVYGATGNPYDTSLSAGGSSGGAACSLAMRMQAVADGSDFMGSLRNPAGWCNVYGYRPSWGRIPPPGLELFMNQFAVRGPMGRTVPDVALLLATLAGYSATTPASLDNDVLLDTLTPGNVHEHLKADHKGKKVAWLGDWGGYLPMEPGVLPLCEEALKTFSAFGVGVEALKAPIDPDMFWNEIWLPLRHFGSIHLKVFYDNPEKRKLLKPEAVYEYEGSLKYSAQDIYAATGKRSDWYRKLLTVFETYDAVAVPTAQVFPFDKTTHWPKEIEGKKMDTYHRWMEVVTHWTMSGCPVVAVPAGFDPAGRSMGIQLVGKPRGDLELLRLAHAYEQENDWVNTHRPKLLDA